MFCYIKHSCTPWFAIGLVKSESESLISWDWSREMNSGCWGSCEQFWYFLAFSDLTCHLEETWVGFFGCTVPLDSKEIKLGSNQEASPSAGIVPYHACNCVSTAISSVLYSSGLRVSFVVTNESLVSVIKIISKIGVSWTHTLFLQFLPLFNSVKWPYHLKHKLLLTKLFKT